MNDAPSDIIFHYPPELFNLTVDVVPLLNRSKQDVLVFFRGAGVPDNITSDIAVHLRAAPKDVNKYQMVRTVLERLNAKGNTLSVNGARCCGAWWTLRTLIRAGPQTNLRPKVLSPVSAKSSTKRRFHAHEQCPRRRTANPPR